MLHRSLPRRFIIVKTVFIRHDLPINFPTFFMIFVFGGVNYCRSRFFKKDQRQAKVWQLKRAVFQAEHVTFTD